MVTKVVIVVYSNSSIIIIIVVAEAVGVRYRDRPKETEEVEELTASEF